VEISYYIILCINPSYSLLFFFSSRRRHTRFSRDWSSDVCSSDLWRDPHNLGGPDSIWQGNIGIYEGAYFVESPRIYTNTDGEGSATVYRSLFFGREALAEAVAEEPHTVIGNVTDKLMRMRPVGWYGVLGWSRFREAALIRGESASSISEARF